MTQRKQEIPEEAILALKKTAYEVYERGGRFGEDIKSVRCKLCKEISTDEKDLRHKKNCLLYGKGGL